MNNKITNFNIQPNLKLQFKNVTSYYPFKTISKLEKNWKPMTLNELHVSFVKKHSGIKSPALLKDLEKFGFITYEPPKLELKMKPFFIHYTKPNRVSLV